MWWTIRAATYSLTITLSSLTIFFFTPSFLECRLSVAICSGGRCSMFSSLPSRFLHSCGCRASMFSTLLVMVIPFSCKFDLSSWDLLQSFDSAFAVYLSSVLHFWLPEISPPALNVLSCRLLLASDGASLFAYTGICVVGMYVSFPIYRCRNQNDVFVDEQRMLTNAKNAKCSVSPWYQLVNWQLLYFLSYSLSPRVAACQEC